MDKTSQSHEGFRLESRVRTPPRKKWRLPDQIVEFSIPGPDERSITISVTLRRPNGKIVQVPVVWHPGTNVLKKLPKLSWKELGITERLNRLRIRVIQLAKKEHARLAKRHSSLDMFGQDES